ALPWRWRRKRPLRSPSSPTGPACTGITASGSATRCTWKCAAGCLSSRGRSEAGPPMSVSFPAIAVMAGRGRALATGLALAAFMAAGAAGAAELAVPAGGSLQAAIGRAAPGDVLRLDAGVHAGPAVIDKPLTLVGGGDAIVEANGTGSVLRVEAPDVVI